ncbi:hypothetical protein ACHAXT_007024 [Thalassiosira profunda]
MSSTPKKDESTEGSSESPSKKSAEKDDAVTRLNKSFRTYSSSMVMATKQAKKMADLQGEGKAKSKDKKGAADRKQAEGQLKLAAEALIKYRQQVRQTVTALEGKIRGNAKESEALECSLRSQPCIGGRARKRKFACDE